MKVKLFRLWLWWLYAAVLLGLIAWVAPQQIEVVLYKLTLVALATVVAYMADRELFKRCPVQIRAVMPKDTFGAARLIARSLIFIGVVLGLTLGL